MNNQWTLHRVMNTAYSQEPKWKTSQFPEHWVEYAEGFTLEVKN